MELKPEIAHYIVRYHAHLMTVTERRAQIHLFATMKATMGRSDMAAQKLARNDKVHSRMLSNDADVLRLAREGFAVFEARTAERILRDAGKEVLLNRCPKCSELARTPTAKQCRFCGSDWHDAK